MDRISIAVWSGSGKEGQGTVSTPSGALDKTPISYHSRYLDGLGTNPEELLAAAHATCFSMKLSFLLGEAGFTPESIETTSKVTLGKHGISQSHLHVKAKIPGISRDVFERCANDARDNCPVSKALKIKITLETDLLERVKANV